MTTVKSVIAAGLLLVASASGAQAIPYSFSCTGVVSNNLCTQSGSGGTVSAELDFQQIDADTIVVTVDNTSPTEFIPALVSFGFFVDPDDAKIDTFTILAKDKTGAPTNIEDFWQIDQNDQGLEADFIPNVGNGIQDGLYNWAIIGTPSEGTLGNTNPFFTTAVFTFNFDKPVSLAFEDRELGSGLEGPVFVRFQRTGAGAQGSAKVTCRSGFPGCGVTEVPEPATLALLGTGLMGLALVRRRRRVGP